MASGVPAQDRFLATWNALPRAERLRLRRLVRMGRPFADRQEASLAAQYARFQRGRVWTRYFWFWFVPGLLLALGVAGRIHPVVIGAVLALAAQGAFAHHNLKKAARSDPASAPPA